MFSDLHKIKDQKLKLNKTGLQPVPRTAQAVVGGGRVQIVLKLHQCMFSKQIMVAGRTDRRTDGNQCLRQHQDSFKDVQSK